MTSSETQPPPGLSRLKWLPGKSVWPNLGSSQPLEYKRYYLQLHLQLSALRSLSCREGLRQRLGFRLQGALPTADKDKRPGVQGIVKCRELL